MYDVSWYDRIAYNPNVVTASISSIIALSETVTNKDQALLEMKRLATLASRVYH